MGGAAAWENADSLEEACQKEGCNNRRIVYACFNIEIVVSNSYNVKLSPPTNYLYTNYMLLL